MRSIWGSIGILQGYIGIMEQKMETTIQKGRRADQDRSLKMVSVRFCCSFQEEGGLGRYSHDT